MESTLESAVAEALCTVYECVDRRSVEFPAFVAGIWLLAGILEGSCDNGEEEATFDSAVVCEV